MATWLAGPSRRATWTRVRPKDCASPSPFEGPDEGVRSFALTRRCAGPSQWERDLAKNTFRF